MEINELSAVHVQGRQEALGHSWSRAASSHRNNILWNTLVSMLHTQLWQHTYFGMSLTAWFPDEDFRETACSRFHTTADVTYLQASGGHFSQFLWAGLGHPLGEIIRAGNLPCIVC